MNGFFSFVALLLQQQYCSYVLFLIITSKVIEILVLLFIEMINL